MMKQQMMTNENSNWINGIDMDVLMETIQAVSDDADLGVCRFRATNQCITGSHNRSTITGFYGAKQEIAHLQTFELDADEPPILAGNDVGANPVEYLLGALASCLTTSIVALAAVRGMYIESIESTLEGDLDLNGFFGLDENMPKGFTNIRVNFRVKSSEDVQALLDLSQFSPVFNTLTNGVKVDVNMESM